MQRGPVRRDCQCGRGAVEPKNKLLIADITFQAIVVEEVDLVGILLPPRCAFKGKGPERGQKRSHPGLTGSYRRRYGSACVSYYY